MDGRGSITQPIILIIMICSWRDDDDDDHHHYECDNDAQKQKQIEITLQYMKVMCLVLTKVVGNIFLAFEN